MTESGEIGHVLLGGRRYTVQRNFGLAPSDLPPARISQVAVDSSGGCTSSAVESRRLSSSTNRTELSFAPTARETSSTRTASRSTLGIASGSPIATPIRLSSSIVSGQPILRLGDRHRPQWEAPFNHPTRAAVAPDGEIFVADGYGNARIHEFSPEGEWRSSFGEIGAGPRQFMTPHSIIVDRDQRLLVCDRENDRVQVFDREGQWLADWRGLCRPMDLCERDDGIILVTDQVPSVTAFAPNGVRIDRCRPSLNGAHGVALGPERRDLPRRDRTQLGDETHSGLSETFLRASGFLNARTL